ncbi:hypothetical protein LP090_03465 [Moraxella bovis]|uniref:hypothetical protein n=1 Tax=Moraxella bovis TaxID=476 RepID=UPI0022263841|nr:hypothetical protein [Moraxella bovis]UYZ67932.1 hypothetical protein LP122_09140 [Moraxella bovis]UYZ70306.1 hypothetical protein LP089_09240 [Moraxella bovis]UYZ73783.1 hypothetical protein LP105_03480 [Moraxella bovis]UZA13606.1 hypothetical protein LP102_09300 [Moraxella bovis]UZA28039.1 hypothetical protein LP119_03465 [Moraxella bovis]
MVNFRLPLYLYPTQRSLVIQLFIFAVCIGATYCFWYVLSDVGSRFINGAILLSGLFWLFFLIIFLKNLITKKPMLIIDKDYIIGRGIFNDKLIGFDDIADLSLHIQANHRFGFMVYRIDISLKTGDDEFLVLNTCRYGRTLINEKEIFALIKQIHKGTTPPRYEPFYIGNDERMTSTAKVYWTVMAIGAVWVAYKIYTL